MKKKIFKTLFFRCMLIACLSVITAASSALYLSSVYSTGKALIISTFGCVILFAVLSGIFALFASKKLTNSLQRQLNKLNPANLRTSRLYPEFTPLADKITKHNERTQNQISLLESEHQAQDKMRREFTANVSHELKTPLTSISGYAEIIRDGLVQENDIPQFAGRIYDESKRMITLVGDIIKLSQLDENEISVNIERIDLYDCCEAVLQNLEPLAAKKGISLSLTGDHAQISGAEIIIEEIVYNICDNAVKYNKENGSVDVHIRQCIDGVELTVKDTGIGIAEEDIDHIFERFYRADKSHSREIGGTGLGLSIVKHGAMFHNATISIDSKLHEGTTVRILF